MVLTEFREKLEELLNNSNLTIDAVYFVMKDVMLEVETLYHNLAMEEKIKLQQEEQKNNEDRIKEENERLAQEMNKENPIEDIQEK